MSTDRKRKWDQPGEEDAAAKVAKTDESQKSATAAAAAVCIFPLPIPQRDLAHLTRFKF